MADPDPLLDLFRRVQSVLSPFGIHVDDLVLKIWREQHALGQGPFWWSERGNTRALDELIGLLRELRGDGPPGGT